MNTAKSLLAIDAVWLQEHTLIFDCNRILYRWRRIGLKKDDFFLIPAMGLALAQSICLQLAVNAGLGKRPSASQTVKLDHFQKVRLCTIYLQHRSLLTDPT